MRVGIVYDPVFHKHDTGDHVENSGRLTRIMSCLEQTELKPQLCPIVPRPATVNELSLVHYTEHILRIQSISLIGGGFLNSETVMSAGSYESAVYAAGGAIRAAEEVMDGKVDSAFALIRPPGHHATPGEAMGFCLFNNIAIAAKYISLKYQLDRLAIIDFDVHHGNGTQAAFYTDPKVLYASVHQHPLFPGPEWPRKSASEKRPEPKSIFPYPPVVAILNTE